MDTSAKILLLGKTGVGKSSFINYFIGEEKATAGSGKPVNIVNFDSYEVEGSNHSNKITIYDTKGLEALNADKQMNEIISEIIKHNNSDNIFDWFHTIFYCISFSNTRFEDFEIDFINKLQKKLNQHIHIIITHCDANNATPESISKMKEKIKSDLVDSNNIEIFEVVSIEKKKRNGKLVEPRGKEIIAERIFEILLQDIAYKISDEYAETLRYSIEQIVCRAFSKFDDFIEKNFTLRTLIDFIKNFDVESSNLDRKMEEVFSKLEDEFEYIKEKTDEKFLEILKPVAEMYSSYYGFVSGEDFLEDFCLDFSKFDWIETDWMDDLDEKKAMSKIMPNIAKHADENGNFPDEPSSFWEIFQLIGGGIGDLFSLKTNCKKILDEMKYDFLYNSMPSQRKMQEDVYKKIIDIF